MICSCFPYACCRLSVYSINGVICDADTCILLEDDDDGGIDATLCCCVDDGGNETCTVATPGDACIDPLGPCGEPKCDTHFVNTTGTCCLLCFDDCGEETEQCGAGVTNPTCVDKVLASSVEGSVEDSVEVQNSCCTDCTNECGQTQSTCEVCDDLATCCGNIPDTPAGTCSLLLRLSFSMQQRHEIMRLRNFQTYDIASQHPW